MLPTSPTIAAIATGPASGGIGVIRLSGPRSLEAALSLSPDVASPAPRHAYFTRFVDAQGERLDDGLFIYFQAPHSYTAEDVVELQAHGSPRLLRLLLERVLAHPSVRLAEPGEFTRRAFLNGRIDLARAEAVADLVSAESQNAVRAAAAQLAGGLSAKLARTRSELLAVHADLEASLDFPEEAEGADSDAGTRLSSARAQLGELLGQARMGTLIRRGARVVLYGPVNAGKSTLFNALLRDARALVDDEPGTTRDALEARLELDGLAVTLVDTAGLRAQPGRIEALGIERTEAQLKSADVSVLVIPPEAGDSEIDAWRSSAREPLEVFSKADLFATKDRLSVSAKTGTGVDRLREALSLRLRPKAQAVSVTSERHFDALRRADESLGRALDALEHSTVEVVAGETGLALTALGEITGEDVSKEVLDAIFQRFCIGK